MEFSGILIVFISLFVLYPCSNGTGVDPEIEVDTVEVIVDGYALEASLSLLTYQEAREFCRTRGGDLAHHVVKNMQHRRTVADGLNLTAGSYWLGLDNIDDGTWRWVNGDVVDVQDVHWAARSPATTGHNCGYMQNDGDKNLQSDNWWSCKQNAVHALCEAQVQATMSLRGGYTTETTRTIVTDETTLKGYCHDSCEDIHGPINNKPELLAAPYYCKTVKNCRFNSKGHNKGTYRCDMCACDCISDQPEKNAVVTETIKWFSEESLYGVCKFTCDHNGLVRTNFGGCDEVRDCRFAQKDHNKGIYVCDNCQCNCVQKKYAEKYVLENVRYEMSETAIKVDKPAAMALTIVENHSSIEQITTRNVGFEFQQSLTTETTKTLDLGLEMTVEAGFDVKAMAASFATTRSLNAGFQTLSGQTNTETITDSINAAIKVPPHMQVSATVVAHHMNIDVPYTADLVTIFPDGTRTTEKQSGVFYGVECNQFRVIYDDFSPLPPPSTGPQYVHIVPAAEVSSAITAASQGSNFALAKIDSQNEALLFEVSELNGEATGMIYHKSTGNTANVANGWTAEGTPVMLWVKEPNAANELWTYRDGRIVSSLNNMVMELLSDGTIVMMPRTNDLTQLWSFKPLAQGDGHNDDICGKVQTMGWCLDENGKNQDSGTTVFSSPANCLAQCEEYPGATGCEVYKDAFGKEKCTVHTKPVSRGSDSNSYYNCWVFERCVIEPRAQIKKESTTAQPTTVASIRPIRPTYIPCPNCTISWPSYCQGRLCRIRWPYHQQIYSPMRCSSSYLSCRASVQRFYNPYFYKAFYPSPETNSSDQRIKRAHDKTLINHHSSRHIINPRFHKKRRN